MNTQQRMGMFRHVLRLILNYKAVRQENVYSTGLIHIVPVSYYRKQYLIKMKSKNHLNGTHPHCTCELLSQTGNMRLPFIYSDYMHYSLTGNIRLPFIDSDLLYRGALYRQ
jgi:hypothetical protein